MENNALTESKVSWSPEEQRVGMKLAANPGIRLEEGPTVVDRRAYGLLDRHKICSQPSPLILHLSLVVVATEWCFSRDSREESHCLVRRVLRRV